MSDLIITTLAGRITLVTFTQQGAGGANAAPPTTSAEPVSAPARSRDAERSSVTETAAAPRSWSQLSSYRKCGKAYELEKITRAPRRGAVWFSFGTAVHASIETYLREHLEAKHV